ncbi:MAG: hypothetical protein KA153_02765 [Hyphomonadaceae bacterium]|jgi:hypothetical protein|nr:hypothetical protein [Hyphomonadaceae bacterium]
MRAFTAIAIALLGACASAPTTPTADTTRISYEVSSWGYVQERWTIAADGQATFEHTEPGAQLGSPLLPAQTFELTSADFERIRSTLAPTERFIADRLTCEVQMTDAPYGAVKWQRVGGTEQQVSFYSACRETRDTMLFFTQLNAADHIFHQLTNAPTH